MRSIQKLSLPLSIPHASPREHAPPHPRQPPHPRAGTRRSTLERKLTVVLGVGIASIALFAVHGARSAAAFAAAASLGLVVAGAAMLTGGLMGFLFGIPRTLQGEREAGDAAGGAPPETQYRANTNLEQISDWLTKILVGVGLTQVGAIRRELGALGDQLESGFARGAPGRAFALALVAYFVICGFLYGYLWARLNLLTAFESTHYKLKRMRALQARVEAASRHAEEVGQRVQKLEEKARIDAEALALVNRQLDTIPGAAEIPGEALVETLRHASRLVLIQVFQQARTLRSDCWEGRQERGLVAKTIPVFRALAAIDEEGRFHRNWGQLGYALKDQPVPEWREAESALSRAIEIRDRQNDLGFPTYELCRAICRIQQDAGYRGGERSDERSRRAILADLRVAMMYDQLHPALAREADIRKWLELNGVTAEGLFRSHAPAEPAAAPGG